MQAESVQALLRRISYFTDVPAAELEQLAAACRRRRLAEKEPIFHAGEPAPGLFYLVSGRVKAVRYSADGREFIIREFRPGETFNEVGAIDGGLSPATAIAMESGTEVLLIPGEALRRLTARHSHVDAKIMTAMAGKLRFAMEKMDRLALLDVKRRLVSHLLDLAPSGGEIGPLSQEELAAQLGTVRQVVGRALAELQAGGAIEVRRAHIVIRDRARLAALLEG